MKTSEMLAIEIRIFYQLRFSRKTFLYAAVQRDIAGALIDAGHRAVVQPDSPISRDTILMECASKRRLQTHT
jgi:hypothetical protein